MPYVLLARPHPARAAVSTVAGLLSGGPLLVRTAHHTWSPEPRAAALLKNLAAMREFRRILGDDYDSWRMIPAIQQHWPDFEPFPWPQRVLHVGVQYRDAWAPVRAAIELAEVQ